MPYLPVELDAVNVAPDLARAAGVSDDAALAGLIRMWAWVFRAKLDQVAGPQLAGFFGGEPGRLSAALVAFGFLEPREGGWRVKGADRLLSTHKQRVEAGKARAAAAAGRSAGGRFQRSTSGQPATGQRSTSGAPALTPSTQHPAPSTQDLAAGAAVPVEPLAAPPPPAPKPSQRAPAPARATNGGGELVLEAQTPHEPARARQALIAALGESFREIRGATYAYQGRDWKALDRLRAQQTDEEILRRWERGLRAQYKARVDSIADLEQRWNANATPERGSAATAPPIDENGDCALCKARPGEPHRDWCQRGRKTG